MSQPQATHPFKVIIIWAGLAGSLLANGLLHASVPVAVYERGEENNSSGGYQIHLGESALIGLRACMSEAEISSVVAKFGRAGGRKGQAAVLRHKDLGLLLDLKAFPDYTKSAPIKRGILRDALAADKHFEDACKAFEDEMIPRTFEWVKKSGGNETIVCIEDLLMFGLR